MKYKFRGRVSTPLSWLIVYRFDPCDGQGKPVIATKSSIYIHGKKLGKNKSIENTIIGTFEATEVFKTSQKYDYAGAMMTGVETVGNPVTSEDVTKKCSLIVNSVYHGIVIDYVGETDVYVVTFGSRLFNLPSHMFSDCPDVSPGMLSTSVVCFKVKTGHRVSTDSCTVRDFKVKCFQAQTFSKVDTVMNVSTTNNLVTNPTSTYLGSKQKLLPPRTVCDRLSLQSSSSLDLVPPTAPTPVSRTSVRTVERLFPGVVKNAASALPSSTSHSVEPKLQKNQSHSFTSNEVSSSVQSKRGDASPSPECDESVSLTMQELDDLAPKLTTLQKLYEKHGIYDKPIVTIS